MKLSAKNLSRTIMINGIRVVGAVGSNYAVNLLEENLDIMRDNRGAAPGSVFVASAVALTMMPPERTGRKAAGANAMRNLLEGSAIMTGAELGGILLDKIMSAGDTPPPLVTDGAIQKSKADFMRVNKV